MGRDSWRGRQQEAEREKRKRMNPVWRGVGCMMMTVLAMGGYLFSNWFIVQNATQQWVYLPPEVIRPAFAAWLPPGALVSGSVALLFLVFSFLFINIAYAIFFPLKPGEHDIPPLRRDRRPRP